MSSSLISSLRALSLRANAKPAASRVLPALCLRLRQPATRRISQSSLTPRRPTMTTKPAIPVAIPAAAAAALIQQQQTRGMKVHSSVKKRCEHCKVSYSYSYPHAPALDCRMARIKKRVNRGVR